QAEEWAAVYGDLYALRVGKLRTVVVSDPALAQPVFRARPETWRRTRKLEQVFIELGVAGVFSAEGAAWRSQRRLAMEALSHRHLRGFYPTLASVADRLRRRWAKAAASGEELDIQDDLMRFTVDVTTTLVFGRDLDTLGGGQDVIQR